MAVCVAYGEADRRSGYTSNHYGAHGRRDALSLTVSFPRHETDNNGVTFRRSKAERLHNGTQFQRLSSARKPFI